MNLPDSFIQYTRRLMGDSLYTRFVGALDEDAPVSIRVNPLKSGSRRVVVPGAVEVPWCDGGYYLPERPNFTFDPLLHAGCYYVQEASSMFVHHVLRCLVKSPVRMLDLCAAPGGKSTAAVSALPAGSFLISNEPVRVRANVLAENIMKWGAPDVAVTNNYPADYARSGLTFDVILCDVPCSGEGMFRKDEGAVAEWSPQNVERCSSLQREIVGEAWKCLRPGGLLIYSTCTFNAKENEENVAWIVDSLGGEPVSVPVEADWGIHGSLLEGFNAPVCRFIPGCTRGEGLFMAVVRKPAEQQEETLPSDTQENGEDIDDSAVLYNKERRNKGKNSKGKYDKDKAAKNRRHAKDKGKCGERTSAGAAGLTVLYEGRPSSTASTTASSRSAGSSSPARSGRGSDERPDHALALSAVPDSSAFQSVDVSYAQAVAYLRREAIVLPPDTPRGFVIVKYRGAALGFVKNVGNRANNLYPQEWKIKSTHVPDEPHVME